MHDILQYIVKQDPDQLDLMPEYHLLGTKIYSHQKVFLAQELHFE